MSTFNHVGQCVTDLERSKRFHCELLGFTLERRPYEVAFENWKADAMKRGNQVTADLFDQVQYGY